MFRNFLRTNSKAGVFGGPMVLGTWTWQLLCGTPWALEDPYWHPTMVLPTAAQTAQNGAVLPEWAPLRGLVGATWLPMGSCAPPFIRAAHYFYGGFTQNPLAFTPSQNAISGEPTLGYKTYVNIPPSHNIAQAKGNSVN